MDPTTTSMPSPSYLPGPSFGTLFHFAGPWIPPDSGPKQTTSSAAIYSSSGSGRADLFVVEVPLK
jgi:hypothetical protein